MRSYSSYIAGADNPSSSWVYTIRSSALLTDFLPNLKLKRQLERGLRDDGHCIAAVAARCALTSESDLQQALVQAKKAAPLWAAFPLDTRMRLGEHPTP